MNRGHRLSLIMALGVLGISIPSLLSAQNNAQNFDLKIETDKGVIRAGEELGTTIVLATRVAGAQGWSFSIDHDPALLEILSATSEGSDFLPFFRDGFEKTDFIIRNDVPVGFFQGVILGIMQDATLPVAQRLVVAKARYRARQNVCDNRTDEIPTRIKFNGTLSVVPGGPEIGVAVTLNAQSIEPSVQQPADIKVSCIQAPVNLRLAMELPANRNLFADGQDRLDINILLSNQGQAPGNPVDVQAWSYSILLDPNLLEADEPNAFDASAAIRAINGGQGPDFKSYNTQDQNTAGTIRGVTAGVAISLNPPFEVLPLPAGGQARHLDTLRVRYPRGRPPLASQQTTQLEFATEKLGRDRPTELLVVVEGQGLVPDFSTKQAITLVPGALEVGRFFRADANNDRRVDIADGIWIINFLFYGGPRTPCEGSIDANDDNTVDISDAMYIFNWQLQPGIRPGDPLFRQPPPPFGSDFALACGIDPDLTPARCPRGSTQCDR